MTIKRVVLGIIAFACVGLVILAIIPKIIGINFYMKRLDAWVTSGGPISEVQSAVVENCGKLVMSSAGIFENMKILMTFGREDFDFRVDVCTKMTVNRVHKQPEFENEKIVSTICDGKDDLLRQLCRQSGLRSN